MSVVSLLMPPFPARSRLLAVALVAMAIGTAGCGGARGNAGPTPAAAVTATPVTHWLVRAVDSMKVSRDTARTPLSDRQIADVVSLDAGLHLTHVTVDVYYDDPAYLARWVRAIRAVGLHVWFRAHWYGWEDHRVAAGPAIHGKVPIRIVHATMTPGGYIEATRAFLRGQVALLANGDIFDFCPEPENGAYWLRTYGPGWSWRNPAAKHAFNVFLRAGVGMAGATLANRGLSGVTVTAISVNSSVATRLFSKPTVRRLGMITLDLYPERLTRDPATATSRLLAELARVHHRWGVPILIGEHGYARDFAADDATQARVLAAELDALRHVPYVLGLNYWVDAGGPGYGGFTNLYRRVGTRWQPRPAAGVLARVYTLATAAAP